MVNWAKYVGLFFMLFCFVTTSQAQTHFQKKVEGNFQNNYLITDHALTPNNGFWILGKQIFTAGTSQNRIIKTDSLGDTLFVKNYNSLSEEGYSQLISAADGGVYAIGTIEPATAVIRQVLFVTKLNSNGEEVWSQFYWGEHYETPHACLHNGVIYIGGIVSGITSSTATEHVYLIRINGSDGALLGSDFKEAISHEEITGIAVNQSGFIALSGVCSRFNPQGSTLLIVADASGTMLFFNTINISGMLGEYSRANGVATVGDKIVLTGELFGVTAKNRAFVLKLDNPLSTMGERLIVKSNHSLSLLAIAHQNNSIVAGGYRRDATGMTKNLLLGINPDLSIKWAKTYGLDSGRITAIKILPNNDISATGVLPRNGFYGITLMKTDKVGFSGCMENTYTVETELQTINFKQYVPNGSVLFPTESPTFIFLEGMANFAITKVCNPDSCKAGFTLSKDTLCANTCITITDTSINAANWQWSFSGGTPATFSGQNPNQVCFSSAGNKAIKLVVSNAKNSDSVEKTIYVHPLPIANAGIDTTLCKGQEMRLQGSGGQVYSWFPSDFKNSPSLPNPRVSPDSSIRYYLTVLDSNNCEGTDSVLVSVIQPPTTVSIDSTICDDETIRVDAENAGFNYLWSTGETNRVAVLDTGKHFVILSNTCFADTSFYTLTGKDCNPFYYIPTAFTPNGDGLNDVFTVYGENIAHIKMTIYDRWGELIFNGTGKSPSWNGGFRNTICPPNQYLYIIELQDNSGKKYNAKGTFTLLR